jgi:hypothetical protein
MPLVIQMIVICVLAGYLVWRRIDLKRKNTQNWEELRAQVHLDLVNAGESHGLREMFDQSRVLLEMIDYAELNGLSLNQNMDSKTLEALRSDAMQVRVLALARILQLQP